MCSYPLVLGFLHLLPSSVEVSLSHLNWNLVIRLALTIVTLANVTQTTVCKACVPPRFF